MGYYANLRKIDYLRPLKFQTKFTLKNRFNVFRFYLTRDRDYSNISGDAIRIFSCGGQNKFYIFNKAVQSSTGKYKVKFDLTPENKTKGVMKLTINGKSYSQRISLNDFNKRKEDWIFILVKSDHVDIESFYLQTKINEYGIIE